MIIAHPDLTTTYDMNTKILSDYCQRQSTCNNLHLSGNFPKRIKSFCRFRFNQLLDEVPSSPMMTTILELLYERFAAHTQTTAQPFPIPETIPVGLHHSITQVWTELIGLKPESMGELNSRALSADPGSLVPVCIAIINIYDQYGAEEHEDPVRTYGF
ncbi:hypothetical protein, partial, partial [Absidia glauca]